MNQRNKAACLIAACIIFISLISVFVKEVCNNEKQTSSFWVDKENGKVVVIAADYLELQDFAKNDYLSRLFNSSYSALISGRQNGKASLAKAKLSIGASKRLEINSDMKAAKKQGNIVYEDIDSLKELNKDSEYNSFIGYIGRELNKHNKITCVIGNSDTEISDKSSVLLAMDQNGIVDTGDIDNTLILDDNFPGEKKTDYKKLMELYNKYSPESDLIVIDTGDLARLEYYKEELPEEVFKAHKSSALNDMAEFINELITNSYPETTFVLLSSYPDKGSIKSGFKLTPIIVYNDGQGGLIYSESTKRNGIIVSLDIADFILETLTGIEKSKLYKVPETASLKKMLNLKKRLLSISTMRLPVLTWYAILEIFCATGGFLYMINSKKQSSAFSKYVKIIMLANIVAPAVLLYMSVINIHNASLYLALCIIFSLIIASLLYWQFKSSTGQFIGAALFVNLSLAIDLFRESAFIKNSIFGYDPIIGARFYGIGNEFAGVFIGSGILLAGCLLQYYKGLVEKKPKAASILLIIYILMQLFITGMPFLGANFGGTIAAVVGYFFFYSSYKKHKIKLRHLLTLSIVLILILSTIIALDLLNPKDTTHVGRFITDIKDNGIKVLLSTIARKAEMNLRLIKYTIWTKVLLCIILIITIMFFKPVRLLHKIFKKYRFYTTAWIGISAGSIAGLIANDSGIVMAATAMIFTGYTILYICLEEMETVN